MDEKNLTKGVIMEIQRFILGPVSSNCYVITDEKSGETAVIDCGECTDELLDTLKDKNLKYIFLTHGHADHILGVHNLKEKFPQAKIVIHCLDADCLKDEHLSLGDEILPGAQESVSADITVKEGDKFSLGETEITVIHTPGHTKGGVCYYIEKEHILFTGDTLFCLTVGRTDLGGSDEDLYNSVKRLYDMDGDYDIYPGHNRSTTMEYEKRRNRYMRRFK
jgi:hydroxyacylglutathione hydrolase